MMPLCGGGLGHEGAGAGNTRVGCVRFPRRERHTCTRTSAPHRGAHTRHMEHDRCARKIRLRVAGFANLDRYVFYRGTNNILETRR